MKKKSAIFIPAVAVFIVGAFYLMLKDGALNEQSELIKSGEAVVVGESLALTKGSQVTLRKDENDLPFGPQANKPETSEIKTETKTTNQHVIVDPTIIDGLNGLLVQDTSDLEFYKKANRFYALIPSALTSGKLDHRELSELALSLFASSNIRELKVAIRLTAELGDPTLVSELKTLFELTYDTDLQGYILEEMGRMRSSTTYSVNALIALAEMDEGKFSMALSRQLIISGVPEALDWAETKIVESDEAETLAFWLDALENVGHKASDEPVVPLIAFAESTTDYYVQLAAFRALGRIGSIEAQRYLYSTLREGDSPDQLLIIAESLARASHQQSWAQIRNQFLFGVNLNDRLVALNSYAIGYQELSKVDTLTTLSKLSNSSTVDFPLELIQEAERLYLAVK